MPESPKEAGSTGKVTSLLAALAGGDESARPRIIELLYDELRRLAAEVLREKRRGGDMQRTDLIGEAFLRLNAQQKIPKNSGHFLAIAAQVMRRVVVDHARTLNRLKRGGAHKHEDLPSQLLGSQTEPLDILVMDEHFAEIERMDERTACVFVYRFYGGYTDEETATLLGLSVQQVELRWRAARGLLSERLRRPPS
jgi:RNA polymerase sigma factor (TIGR02999 family)